MQLTEEVLNKELTSLTEEREKLMANIHRVNGAISMTEILIKKLKTPDEIIKPGDAKKNQDDKSK